MEIKQTVKVELTEKEEDILIQAQAILKEVCQNLDNRCEACPLKELCDECSMEPHIVVLNALNELIK